MQASRLSAFGKVRIPKDVLMTNGQGFPQLHFEREINSASKLVHVCDVYDARRTDRPFREAWGSERVLQDIEKHTGPYFRPDAATLPCAMMRRSEQQEVAA